MMMVQSILLSKDLLMCHSRFHENLYKKFAEFDQRPIGFIVGDNYKK